MAAVADTVGDTAAVEAADMADAPLAVQVGVPVPAVHDPAPHEYLKLPKV
jgi:hypothetical protein